MNKRRVFEIVKKNKIVVGIVGGIVTIGLVGGVYGIYKIKKDSKILTESNIDGKKALVSNNKSSNDDEQEKNNNDDIRNKEINIKKEKDGQAKKVDKKNKEEKNKENSLPNNKPVEKKENMIVNKNNNSGKSSDVNKKNTSNEVIKKPVDKSENKPAKVEQTGLAGKIARTKTAQKTNQIILVNGSNVSLWNKSGDNWNRSVSTSGRYGYGGFVSASSKREGDGATPTGSYPILYAFGMGSNPGTSLGYKRITKNSYFVDDVNSEYYNQWYEGTGQKGEHMIDHPQYKYGLVVGYNTTHTPGKGSAIFLHCNGKGNTAGCVSVQESIMLRLLKEVHSGAYVIITSSENNLKYY